MPVNARAYILSVYTVIRYRVYATPCENLNSKVSNVQMDTFWSLLARVDAFALSRSLNVYLKYNVAPFIRLKLTWRNIWLKCGRGACNRGVSRVESRTMKNSVAARSDRTAKSFPGIVWRNSTIRESRKNDNSLSRLRAWDTIKRLVRVQASSWN